MKKYQVVLFLAWPEGILYEKFILQLKRSLSNLNWVGVTPLFFKSHPDESPTDQRGDNSILLLNIKECDEISFSRLELE
ncbi:MAG: hypothetical protein HKO72_08930 [Flavobacteriaceae bacterium]|nr:hypothetical protein [Flavobacteriaceae bacterium]